MDFLGYAACASFARKRGESVECSPPACASAAAALLVGFLVA